MEQPGRIHHDQFWRFDLVAIPLGDFSVTCPDVARNSMVAAFKGVIYAAARANRCRKADTARTAPGSTKWPSESLTIKENHLSFIGIMAPAKIGDPF
jgi:hypothetical protein